MPPINLLVTKKPFSLPIISMSLNNTFIINTPIKNDIDEKIKCLIFLLNY